LELLLVLGYCTYGDLRVYRMKSKLKTNTHLLFWGLIPCILAFTFYNYNYHKDSTLDINVHDTYFVISNFELEVLTLICFFITGIKYYILEKLKRKKFSILILIHFISSVVPYLIFLFKTLLFTRYSNLFLGMSLVLILIALALFFINMVIGIIWKENRLY